MLLGSFTARETLIIPPFGKLTELEYRVTPQEASTLTMVGLALKGTLTVFNCFAFTYRSWSVPAKASASVAISAVPFAVVLAARASRVFATVTRLSSPERFTTTSSVSVNVVSDALSDMLFFTCEGIVTRSAPVHPVSVPAVTSASVAISILPATVVDAFGVTAPVSTSFQAPHSRIW